MFATRGLEYNNGDTCCASRAFSAVSAEVAGFVAVCELAAAVAGDREDELEHGRAESGDMEDMGDSDDRGREAMGQEQGPRPPGHEAETGGGAGTDDMGEIDGISGQSWCFSLTSPMPIAQISPLALKNGSTMAVTRPPSVLVQFIASFPGMEDSSWSSLPPLSM